MVSTKSFFLSLLAGLPVSLGAAVQKDNSANSSTCTNGPSSRSCWSDGFDISTNYYENVPDTGVTREYWFNIENTTASPDGVEIPVMLINGSLPGPTIFADWGDEVGTSFSSCADEYYHKIITCLINIIVVHVTNSLQNNGSSIHWHGIRQNYTDFMDGVPSVTQCPIAPGDSFTYKWRAVQYGTGWYHSHFYVQAWDGVYGAIQINGPATADYDVDLGTLILQDWYHVSPIRSSDSQGSMHPILTSSTQDTADNLALTAATSGPPTAENGLINGTNTYNSTSGSRFEANFEAGVRYRIRLINVAADNHMRFMIDNHTLEVIASDFVPIIPYNTTDLSIGMAQRYDVIVTAKNLTEGNFWLRAIPQESCSENDSGE